MIENLIRFQINVYAIVLLVVLFAIIKLKRDIYRFSMLLLGGIIWLTVAALVFEPLSFIFDGSGDPMGIAINYLSNYGLVLVSPVLVGMWASYLDYKIFGDRKRLLKRMYYQQGSLILLVICFVNLFTPLIFSLNADHVYTSGPIQWIGYIFVYSYYLFIIVIAILNRKRITNAVLFGIIAFFLLPLSGSMMQTVNSNLFFAWTMMALATMVVYIFLETSTGIRDFLTKLYSRHTLEDYLTNLMESDRRFGVMMIDLNSFKQINDRYGHQIGDQVLIKFADFFKRIFQDEEMAARLGGDEFFLVFEKLTGTAIRKRVGELQEKVANDAFFQQYGLKGFSWGMSLSEGNKTMDDLFLSADREMYLDKQDVVSPPTPSHT